jgi:flavin reductase (DIM6/NTAB) family NADH-FMN oxidoreductase RutF
MIYKNIKSTEFADEMLEQLQKGAFLTTKKDKKVNIMTIAWGGIQILWGKPFFVVYVRYSRYTYEMLEQNDEFTISVPLGENLSKELSYAGTKSGRDTCKIKDLNLNTIKGRKIDTPVISECELHYECKLRYRQAMEPGAIPFDQKKRYYPNYNYHMIYYGEIVDSYILEGVNNGTNN